MPEVESEKKDVFSSRELGTIGRDILNDLIQSITYLEPVSGNIAIEIEAKLKDRSLFGDNEIRNGKLIVQMTLREPQSK